MRKVAVLTMQRSLNYGAVLQAYALQRRILSFGVQCEIIDLLRPVHSGYRSSQISEQLSPYRLQKKDSNCKGLHYCLKAMLKIRLEKILQRKRIERFRKFDNEFIIYSPKPIYCAEELYTFIKEYDAYVTGSDQVWNPTYPYSPEPYFLTFVPEGIPRIAYAPSFGVSSIDKTVHDVYKKWLMGITRLSVREKQGASLIKEISGRTAEVVLDPTLLLNDAEWLEVSKTPKTHKPYIFCYDLGNNAGLKILCKYLHNYTGYNVYRISNNLEHSISGIIDVYGAGPQEFLGWINGAALVVTNSYHGMVLSINMKKPFYVVMKKNGVNTRNSRIDNILEMLELQDRLWCSSDVYPERNKMELSFDNAMNILKVERKKSLEYLRSSIISSV
ncbi:polysaccharide pyruvyl transferase family protein [Chlorobaculum limnaeum]|uniref:polysaccharide pyruvyl transferase family protein n=1 Tax=Chlorobaculum limnaeum TaxID=274537 RepID=UPI000A030136|nr:polysaccharide pyruvyl transferase family protein [Chlorobaculum limnaeum]